MRSFPVLHGMTFGLCDPIRGCLTLLACGGRSGVGHQRLGFRQVSGLPGQGDRRMKPTVTGWLGALALCGATAVPALLHAQTQPAAPASATSVAAPAPASFAPIPFAPANASAPDVPSAPDAWGGPRTGNEPTLSDRVVDYRIDAALDAAKHAVSGKEQLTWRNRSDREVRSIYVHLYLNAFQNEGSTFFTEREVLTAHGS